MRVITFSRVFPAKHPRKGEPTEFIEKIWKGLYDDTSDVPFPHELSGLWSAYCEMINLSPKYHTIRSGNRWKVGDWFSPRIWSGLPYRSKQIEFAPPIEIKKIWSFKTYKGGFYINDEPCNEEAVAKNDGLLLEDFKAWFNIHPKKKGEEFNGQLLCWSNEIEY